jgi:3-hydroxybutyryl-CoA dehydratase
MNEYRLKDLAPGLKASFQVRITTELIEQFRLLSGDESPLHTDTAFARSRGYPERVAYGMLSAAFYSRLVGVYLPGRFALCHGVDVSFVAPVFPGDELTVSGEVVAVHEALKQIEIKAQITNQMDEQTCRARIRAGVIE